MFRLLSLRRRQIDHNIQVMQKYNASPFRPLRYIFTLIDNNIEIEWFINLIGNPIENLIENLIEYLIEYQSRN